MLYRVCCKTLYSYWSWLEHSHLLSLWKYCVLGCYAAVRTKACLPNARWSFPVEAGGVLRGLRRVTWALGQHCFGLIELWVAWFNLVVPEGISGVELTYACLWRWGVVPGTVETWEWNLFPNPLFPSKTLSVWKGEGYASFRPPHHFPAFGETLWRTWRPFCLNWKLCS